MRGWTLVAIGALPPGLLERAATFLEMATRRSAEIHPGFIEPRYAYDPRRAQYDTRKFLPPLERIAEERGTLVLGVADVDLYSAVFTFVFGEARLHGPAGILSTYRLRPGLYGLPDDPEVFEGRLRRELLHEAGHLIGLVHCKEPDCAMRFSAVAEEIDLKNDEFCETCRSLAGADSRPGGS